MSETGVRRGGQGLNQEMRNVDKIKLRARVFFKRRKNDLVFLLAFCGIALCRSIPHTIGMRLGAFIGGLAYYVLPTERKRALEHLAIAFSEEKSLAERKKIAHACFQNLGRNAVETVNLKRIRNDVNFRITYEGKEYMDQALSLGRGAILLTAHVGNWELLGCFMAWSGYTLNAVARKISDSRLNRILLNFREGESVRVIQRDSPTAGRQLLKAIKNNEIVGILIDQDTTVKGVMADFFGKKANTPAGPAILARRRAVPVVAYHIYRVSDWEHRIVARPPFEIVQTDDISKDIETNTEIFNSVIEQFIREHPEQWVWHHRRWRRRVAS